MYCHHCGTQIDATAAFCPSCGKSVGASPAVWSPPAGVTVRTGHWIGRGWEIIRGDMGLFAIMTILFLIVGGAGSFIVTGALTAGYQIVVMKKLVGRPVSVGDLFGGFAFFLPTLLACVVISLFTFAGVLACIIPGLVVAAMYQFVYLFIVDKKMDFWPAMKASHALVRQDYFGFTIFLIAAALVNVLGFLFCIVGLLWTIPLTYAATTVAYHETVGFDPKPAAFDA